MKVILLTVGRPRGPLAEAIADYQARAARYFSLEVVEVKEEPYRRRGDAPRVRDAEGERLLQGLPPGVELIALHEEGRAWTSPALAEHLGELAVRSSPGVAFAIGGAYGLSDDLLGRARIRLSLGAMTLTHEMARLVLTEQLYRAGTILRGEPYHKGRE